MASLEELSERLLKRFKEVPGVDIEDAIGWIELAMNEHGLNESDNVPTDLILLVMLYAEADGASQIALRTAFYFSYTDRDEAVDKSMIADQYRKISNELWKRYRRRRDVGVDNFGGSRFTIMSRADRP